MPKSPNRIIAAIKRALRAGPHPNEDKILTGNPETNLSAVVQGIISRSERVTVSNLVRQVSIESGKSTDSVLAEIVRLRAGDRIRVDEPKHAETFRQYLISPHSQWFWEMILTTFFCLGFVLVSSGVLLYGRYVVGALFVLFLPGYSLVSLIYPKHTEIDGLTRTVFSFVLSLPAVTLIGFMLNYSPWGISLSAIVPSLSAFTLLLTLLATTRQYGHYKLLAGISSSR